ncbi:MAG: cytidine deaminase [Candidatus Undinarchaeales archaeon]|jgi:cytidine deaminase|nr:cytidine deaminase [Candidatus Undinarchaeales archaeon]MDP7491393.1 cytidine deaminase [Candidatus Undinarchaeales archaeon]
MKTADLTPEQRELVDAAIAAMQNSYCPYSGFRVGAAARTSAGNVHVGCNVESADYTLTSHAEMNAINTAAVHGEYQVTSLAVVLEEGLIPGCGLCRQKMMEFKPPGGDMEVIAANLLGEAQVFILSKLIPHGFGPEDLDVDRSRWLDK